MRGKGGALCVFEAEASEVLQRLVVRVGGAEKVKEPGGHGNMQESSGNCIHARKTYAFLDVLPPPSPTEGKPILIART